MNAEVGSSLWKVERSTVNVVIVKWKEWMLGGWPEKHNEKNHLLEIITKLIFPQILSKSEWRGWESELIVCRRGVSISLYRISLRLMTT